MVAQKLLHSAYCPWHLAAAVFFSTSEAAHFAVYSHANTSHLLRLGCGIRDTRPHPPIPLLFSSSVHNAMVAWAEQGIQ